MVPMDETPVVGGSCSGDDVVQHHGDNAQPVQKVDAGDALLCFLCCDGLSQLAISLRVFSLKSLSSESQGAVEKVRTWPTTDPSASLGTSPAGSRFAHARIAAQINSL
jgi:hypothetical protein